MSYVKKNLLLLIRFTQNLNNTNFCFFFKLNKNVHNMPNYVFINMAHRVIKCLIVLFFENM